MQEAAPGERKTMVTRNGKEQQMKITRRQFMKGAAAAGAAAVIPWKIAVREA